MVNLECNVWGLCYASFPMLLTLSPGSMLSTLLDLQVLFYMFLQEKIDCSPGSTFKGRYHAYRVYVCLRECKHSLMALYLPFKG